LDFHPVLPAQTKVSKVTLNGEEQEFTVEQQADATVVHCDFELKKQMTLEIGYDGGIALLPVIHHPVPGDKAPGVRILYSGIVGKKYLVRLEAPAGQSAEIAFYINGKSFGVDGGKITLQDGNIVRVKVDFEKDTAKYVKKDVWVIL